MITSRVHCIWYPSGGFGHYVNAVLSMYGKGYVRPTNTLTLSKTGDCHSLSLVAPKYLHDPLTYQFEFESELNYSVLIDNGINNESTRFRKFFPDAQITKLCYSDFSWPVVAQTMIVKAMQQDLDKEIQIDKDKWDTNEDWVLREKYFLFLRDHVLRYSWKPDLVSMPLPLEDILDYHTFRKTLNADLDDFELFHSQWRQANQCYFQPILTAQKILQGNFVPVTDIWTQAVVYYQIWCNYGIEVPHNDYSNWFTSYTDIATMLSKHGVNA